ncbi:DUF3263 domain-containing protein [Blastococcus sp. CCUG 61487]|uniref:DUF3263 domain-containing protein n=1 Tax=Blastococcus sp. CCUG 61487 TaxID=1840703 RepID=UPI0010C06FFE|nr:DUF3263 domain-containing protein [Blastococcus sp. CCUG 61487]TKJ20004.1 hypothetical protein A6V29_09345 [Blastococcus sp. CCUG 61487]
MSTDPTAAVPADVLDAPAEPFAPAFPQVSAVELSPRDRAMLEFERQWWRRPGAKETAIRDLFQLPPTRYYQVLNALVDRPEALAADPLLVRRLRRVRAARQRPRPSRGPGHRG